VVTRVYDTREEMEQQAPGHTSVTHGTAVADLAFHVVMLVGAIGMLRLRAWGWWLSLAWAILRFLYQIATAYYVWAVAMPAANRVVQMVPHDEAGVCGGMANGNTFYHVGWAAVRDGLRGLSADRAGLPDPAAGHPGVPPGQGRGRRAKGGGRPPPRPAPPGGSGQRGGARAP